MRRSGGACPPAARRCRPPRCVHARTANTHSRHVRSRSLTAAVDNKEKQGRVLAELKTQSAQKRQAITIAEAELGTPLLSALSGTEQSRVSELTGTVRWRRQSAKRGGVW